MECNVDEWKMTFLTNETLISPYLCTPYFKKEITFFENLNFNAEKKHVFAHLLDPKFHFLF